MYSCSVGRWGNASGASADCLNLCSPGYQCPEKSTTQTPCGSVVKYCTAGLLFLVPMGMYSTPELADRVDTRSGVSSCDPGYYCTSGMRSPCIMGRYGALANSTNPVCKMVCMMIMMMS